PACPARRSRESRLGSRLGSRSGPAPRGGPLWARREFAHPAKGNKRACRDAAHRKEAVLHAKKPMARGPAQTTAFLAPQGSYLTAVRDVRGAPSSLFRRLPLS